MSLLDSIGGLALLMASLQTQAADAPAPREALQALNLLIGEWKATGASEGPNVDRQKDHWNEKWTWGWQFKGTDAWLVVKIEGGKWYREGDVRFLPESKKYQLLLKTPDQKEYRFVGTLKDRYLQLERTDEVSGETERFIFSLLHANRVLYRVESRAKGKTFFTKKFQVGASKEGVPFAEVGLPERECIVSGGLGTMAVMHAGKTYYVCCSGCRDAFRDEPEKYIKEYEAKLAKKAKK